MSGQIMAEIIFLIMVFIGLPIFFGVLFWRSHKSEKGED